jgi:uncharacterized protein YggE
MTLARAAGLSSFTLVSIEEGGSTLIRPPFPMARAAVANAEATTPISPGEQTVTASVILRFAFAADKSETVK